MGEPDGWLPVRLFFCVLLLGREVGARGFGGLGTSLTTVSRPCFCFRPLVRISLYRTTSPDHAWEIAWD